MFIVFNPFYYPPKHILKLAVEEPTEDEYTANKVLL